MTSDRVKIYGHKVLYPPRGSCPRCHWHLTDVDPKKLRREARKHVRETGHQVYVDHEYSWRYEVTP